LTAAGSRRLIAAAALAAALFFGCAPDTRHVQGSGTIELDEYDIASLVGGRVGQLRVDEGDTVRAGDTLAVLQHGEIMGEVRAREAETERAVALWRDQQGGPRAAERKTARAELDAAATALQLANAELKRTDGLHERGLSSDAELDRARAARDEAAAKKAAAEERLALLEEGYRREQVSAAREGAEAAQGALFSSRAKARELILTAPIDGVVLLKNVERGEVVGPGVPLLTLGDPNRLWMRCYLSTPEVARVRVGSAAEVTVLGWKDRVFRGRVVEIATRAEFTPRAALTEEERASVVFGVKIEVDPSGGVLKPGLPADARIETVSAATTAAASAGR
jgi:HlyD family secretion protein